MPEKDAAPEIVHVAVFADITTAWTDITSAFTDMNDICTDVGTYQAEWKDFGPVGDRAERTMSNPEAFLAAGNAPQQARCLAGTIGVGHGCWGPVQSGVAGQNSRLLYFCG